MNVPALAIAIALALSVSLAPYAYAARAQNAAPIDTKVALLSPPTPIKIEHHTSVAELAAHGDADAQFQMGEQLLSQKSKNNKSIKQALVWFMLSGMNGSIEGATAAAKTFASSGEIKDAARWWYRAGQLGDVNARKHFIDLFLNGKSYGIEGKDGATWLVEWALTTHDPATKLALGTVYEEGLGVAPNASEAQRWYMDAAFDGNSEAMVRLGLLEVNLPSLWRSTDKEMDSDGHWTGARFIALRRAARNETDSLDLGRRVISQEENIAPDHLLFDRPGMADGASWLNRAILLASPKAKTALGLAKMDGVTLPMDVQEGLWLLSSAACSNDRTALKALSTFWVDRNPLKSWVFSEVAVRNGVQVPQDQWDHLAKTLTPRQILKAKQIAQDWCAQN